jgi:hypothetical protein
MRLWSLHPQYLDRQGLLALWREGLLALAVLQGKTRGYKNHPQLERFKGSPFPLEALGYYLRKVCREAQARGYTFQVGKLGDLGQTKPRPIALTRGQLNYERTHLLAKLEKRAPQRARSLAGIPVWKPHPLFRLRSGGPAAWEKGRAGNQKPHLPLAAGSNRA